MTKKKAKEIIDKLKEYYGTAWSKLDYNNLYQLSISVVLSAQTTDKQVNAITPALFKKYPNYEKLSRAGTASVEKIIKSVGLYKTKAKNIINLSKMVITEYKGILPDSLENLVKLPGIGRKSANIILSFGYDIPAFPVDTHVKRVAYRMGFEESDDPYLVEKALTKFLPQEYWKIGHLLLINHGRVTCSARNPKCNECPIKNSCDQAGVS